MVGEVKLTFHEGNDETIAVTITSTDPNDDLTQILTLEFYLKSDSCVADDGPSTVILTSADAAEILITSQTADEIQAEVFVPGTALIEPYDRFWHLDALTGTGLRKTALYGPVVVVNL
jgi:hypothetical protein